MMHLTKQSHVTKQSQKTARIAEAETLVFRASLTPKIYRAFEVEDTSSLYELAEAIVRAFDFDFDHAFGFYNKLKGNIYDSRIRYELFVDMEERERGAQREADTRRPGVPVSGDQDALPVRLWRQLGISCRVDQTQAEGAQGQASTAVVVSRQGADAISRPR
jgi:hypothetical protein